MADNSNSRWTPITVHCGDAQECPYKRGGLPDQTSPHVHEDYIPGVLPPLNDILDHIGRTPLVRCKKLEEEYGLKCELYAKCDFFSAGGSVKDRIGRRMILDAEKRGLIKPGDTLIEPTSGNTGIGLALTAAVRGYKMIICMPEKMSSEKANTLRALGAEIIRTPTEAPFNCAESHIGVAQRLQRELPNAHVLDQYSNPSNPCAHYDQTAEELLEQMGGHIDMFVATAGTGGTIAGTACKLKEKCPECIVVGVDPEGSILAEPPEMNDPNHCPVYHVEGIGYDFVPRVLKRQFVDEWVKSNDTDSFLMSRKMISTMGLLCGGSCGSAMAEAVKVASRLEEGQKCVVMLPDSIRNYMTKFLSDDWMIAEGFYDASNIYTGEDGWRSKTVENLAFPDESNQMIVFSDMTVGATINSFIESGKTCLPIFDQHSKEICGAITQRKLLEKINSGWCNVDDVITKATMKVRFVSPNMSLGTLAAIFNCDDFVGVEGQKFLLSRSDLMTAMI